MKFQMKKIINSLVLASVILISCGKDKDKEVAPITTAEITSYVGIGKVVPENGVLILTVDTPSKITKNYKKMFYNTFF